MKTMIILGVIVFVAVFLIVSCGSPSEATQYGGDIHELVSNNYKVYQFIIGDGMIGYSYCIVVERGDYFDVACAGE